MRAEPRLTWTNESGPVCCYITYTGEGFLKMSGWLEVTLSPLSQWILARLDLLISTSWWGLNLPGLVA